MRREQDSTPQRARDTKAIDVPFVGRVRRLPFYVPFLDIVDVVELRGKPREELNSALARQQLSINDGQRVIHLR